MKRFPALIAMCLVFMFATPVYAVNPDEVLADPTLELRASELSKELRCLVCQNQSIDDSDAELARDLRVLVRERLLLGESDTEILDYIVNRYGEYVLLRPVLGVHTFALWAATPLLFFVGFIAVIVVLRRRDKIPEPAMSDAERAALSDLLEVKNDDEHTGRIPG